VKKSLKNLADGWGGKILARLPILKSLQVCTRDSRMKAITELWWYIGIAFLPLPIVILAAALSNPIDELPLEITKMLGRGELMVYAASVCGAILYTLRHNFDGPIPESIKQKTTSLGTLTTISSICMFIILASYLIRRLSDMHSFPLNESAINSVSITALVFSVIVAYVVYSLKYSMSSGVSVAFQEQTDDFKDKWAAIRDA
jgi:hypothetical protein